VSFGLDILLFIVAILSFDLKNNKELLVIIFLFLIIALLSYSLNSNELEFIYFINGIRDFFPFFLFPILLNNVFKSDHVLLFKRYMNRFLYVFLIFQVPFSMQQYLAEGAGDNVVGTLGAGTSGILTFTVYLITYYLMIQDFDQQHFVKSFLKKIYLLFFWLPSFINETKISFLLIIMFFLLLMPLNLKSVLKSVLLLILIIPILFFFVNFYNKTSEFNSFNEILTKEFLNRYLAGEDDIDYNVDFDVPRFTKIGLTFEIQKDEKLLLGNGIGHFKGGSTLPLTQFASEYQWLLFGSIPMIFFILIQVGVLGLLVFLIFWYYLFKQSWKNNLFNYSQNLSLFCCLSFLIIMFYNDSLRSLFFCGIVMYLMVFSSHWKNDIEVANN
jgi:hypothetical protein